MADEEWQVAGGRRKRNGGGTSRSGRPAGVHAAAVAPMKPSMPPTERQIARCCAQLDDAAAELAASPFWAHLTQQLQDALPAHCSVLHLTHMVIYGLGSLEQPGATHIRYQLAAAKLLAALLPLAAAAEAFDPVFTDLDRAALAHCGIQVIPMDEHGRHLAHAPTLFFMPHCEAALTDALLAANLTAGTLPNVVILGNRFSGYQMSWSLPHRPQQAQQARQAQQAQRRAAEAAEQRGSGSGSGGGSSTGAEGPAAPERPDTMLRLCGCQAVQEVAVSERRFPVASAFNDLGLHWFTSDWQSRLEAHLQRPDSTPLVS